MPARDQQKIAEIDACAQGALRGQFGGQRPAEFGGHVAILLLGGLEKGWGV